MLHIPSTIVGSIIEPLYDIYENSVRLKTLRALNRSQWLPTAEILRRQSAALRKMTVHAATHSPFYRERFRDAGIEPADVTSISDLAELPLLSKNDIREQTDRIIIESESRETLLSAKTGGSTGIALQVYCDEKGVQMRNGAALWVDNWSGWRLGQTRAHVWGNPPVPATWKARLRRNIKDRVFFLDTMKLNTEAVDAFAAQWRRYRPGMLFGHAHSIFLVAEAVAASGYVLRPDGIVATSMMLLDHERVLIEKTFDCPVTNRYGCEEVSLIACECGEHRGMHLNSEHVIVEFLRDDNSPCAPGEDGRIVVTELINHGMPMIRYEVGDRGVPSERSCPCGRGLPLLENLTGRTADFLLATDGSRVAGISLIENTLTAMPSIHQMQLVQDRPGTLRVNLVPTGEQFDTTSREELAETFRKALGETFELEIRIVDTIPREASGKYRFSICRI